MSFEPENVVEMYDGNQIGVPENVTQNLAPIEVTGTATRAYAVGDYMVFGGLLRKVTQAIAQGGTITVGTNVDSTKVSTELQGIHSDLSELNCGSGYVEVTADGVKTISTLLNELYSLVDMSKVSGLSYFEKAERRYNLQAIKSQYIVYSFVTVNPNYILTETITIMTNSSAYRSANTVASSTTFTDNSSNVLTSGTKLRLFY